MSSNPLTPEDRSAFAAEYALGLLEQEELAQAIALERADPLFREEVARWTGRLAPLLDDVAPVSPPAGTYMAIEQRINALATMSGSNVIHLRRRLGRWRALAGGASALAASLALFLVIGQPIADPPAAIRSAPPLVATIEDDQGAARLVAMWQRDDRRLTLFPAAIPPAGPDQSHELWIIPSDGKPRSIGLVSGETMNVTVDERTAEHFGGGATLALSLEPAGGSPTGAPTGPVLASGKLQQS